MLISVWHVPIFTLDAIHFSLKTLCFCTEEGLGWGGRQAKNFRSMSESSSKYTLCWRSRQGSGLPWGPLCFQMEPTLKSFLLRSWESLSCGQKLPEISGVDGVDSLK